MQFLYVMYRVVGDPVVREAYILDTPQMRGEGVESAVSDKGDCPKECIRIASCVIVSLSEVPVKELSVAELLEVIKLGVQSAPGRRVK